jgi:hypothetical protein
MANDYSSAYSVIPILHSDSGQIHDVAVPTDMELGDLHNILLNSGYHATETKPTAEGAVENSDAFKQSATKASLMATTAENRVRSGHGEGGEAGFTVQRSGTTSPVDFQSDASSVASGHIKQKIQPEDLGALHTHDYRHSATPSVDDVEAARKAHRVIWVTSRAGLFSVDPSGKVEQIFSKADWMNEKKKK